MKSIGEMFTQIKNIKGLAFILLAAAAGIALIIIGNSSDHRDKAPAVTAESEPLNDYASEIETRVGQLLSGIKEAAGASVMVTLDCGSEIVYARDDKGNGASEYVIIKSNGETALPLKKLTPKVAGIAVVTKGANSEIKLEITRLLSALLDLPTSKIYIW